MSPDPRTSGPRDLPDDSESERLDRNFEQLLMGLRVALPGVQVLFAFLLTLPFQERFEDITSFQKTVYFVTLVATAFASVFLIAPSIRHRMRFRQADKRWIVFSSNRLAIVGVAFLGVAIIGAMVLISDFLYGGATAAIAAGVLAIAVIWVWFAGPMMRGGGVALDAERNTPQPRS